MNMNHKIVPNKLAKSHVGPELRERVHNLIRPAIFHG
jgi:hypothetical protein